MSDAPTLSGAEIVLLQHLRDVRERGDEAHVYLRDSNRRLRTVLEAEGIAHTASPYFRRGMLETTPHPGKLLVTMLSLLRTRRHLHGLLRRESVDVVHSVSYAAALYAAAPTRRAGARQIWHQHDIKTLHRVNRAIFRWIARSCSFTIGPSDAVTATFAAAAVPAQKIRTVYNGIDLERFRPDEEAAAAARRELGIAPGECAVGLLGQMLPYKGHGLLIEAAPQIRARVPCRFFFAGALENPPYQRELEAKIASAGLEGVVTHLGWRGDVDAVLRAMDVVVVPTQRPEPAALVLLEAGAVGRPVVASRSGGSPELVDDGVTGVLVPPGDAGALADAVLGLLASPERARAMGAAGRRRVVERFGLARHLAEVRALQAQSVAAAGGS